jgi:acetyl-CoA carboxylase biotin carboxylase subunit
VLSKVLVANRGEIALRVLRACKELGLASVAVYSEADRTALHVRYADEAYCIGPAPATQSYLRGDRILKVARQAGVDAVHPGYGFLAENPEFARAVMDSGLVFVGPRPEVLHLLGNKIAARQRMSQAGLPVIAGTTEPLPDADLLIAAERIGFPLLVKAAAGGGGKGMRIARSLEELRRSLASASREAQASFGDGTLYLERLIEGVRHIEFQILADELGTVIHLGERECSIQRRFQKLIEETPSPALDADLRQRMGEAAVEVARTAGYTNAGTVEFLLDAEGHFYFLEVNPRLQVEHPATEEVSGVDIVREQLRIAGGRKLRYAQSDVTLRGWALECRILAEDPHDDWRPSIGTITRLREPSGPGVRVDGGVCEGMTITPYYDSLIAKLVVWGESRAEAVMRMKRALDEYRVVGIRTTIPFHQRVLGSARFIAGQLHTRFLETPVLPIQEEASSLEAAVIAAALVAYRRYEGPLRTSPAGESGRSNWRMVGRWRGAQMWDT